MDIAPKGPQAVRLRQRKFHLLRRLTFAGIEALVRSSARRPLPVSRRFGHDALGYFTERLDPAPTRQAAVTAVRQAQRHKAFDNCLWVWDLEVVVKRP